MSAIRIDHTPRRIRARLGAHVVADSIGAKLVYVEGRPPQHFFPTSDIDWDVLASPSSETKAGELGTYHSIASPTGTTVGQRYVSGPAADLTHLDFAAMDGWFEEDEEIWGNPRDPYRRVDVLESSRHIEITVNGVTVAATDRPRLVAETGLPARWYIPRIDVDWSVLQASATQSYCQYKGSADWWNVALEDRDTLVDLVWGYERPIPETSKLAGLVAFYAEHDAVETTIDGEAQPKISFDNSMYNPSFNLVNATT